MRSIEIVQQAPKHYDDGSTITHRVFVAIDGRAAGYGQHFGNIGTARVYADGLSAGMRAMGASNIAINETRDED